MVEGRLSLAIDVTGGDHGLKVTIPACLRVLAADKNLHFFLVGDETVVKSALKSAPLHLLDRLTIQHAPEKVESDDSPSFALRNKKKSSMRLAINLVKEGDAHACVSAGNTGALMATARYVLKMLPGIDRPAIIGILPTKSEKPVRLLDLGANIDSSAEQLYQFAVMGSVLVEAMDGCQKPRVGLLNVGEEHIKGNEQVKKAAHMFSDCAYLNYIGFQEGNDIYSGKADVIVCDGFVGNIALKASEGIANLISHYIKEASTKSITSRLAMLPAAAVLRKVGKRIDPRRHNGAAFLGLNGIVIKSHGSADITAFTAALHEAVWQVKHNIPQLIKKRISLVLDKQE